MKRFFIKTLGCKTNQIESAIIEEKLIADGLLISNNIPECDYFILNSCSVTGTADSKAMVLLKKAKKENPNIKTVLTGCFAQLMAENLKSYDFIDFIVGNEEKTNIAEIIKNDMKYAVSDIFEHDSFKYEKLNSLRRTRATIKIQDGCDNRCAYCTIPLARGNNRSNSIKNVIEQIDTLVSHGYKEAVLTGIHIGQWGMDFKDGSRIIDLLKAIEKTSVHRYRLGSLNPLEFDDELIDFLANSEKFCPHFHMSLQSACDKTLKNMNRYYTQDLSAKLIDKLNDKFDNAFIGSDIIVGFPGETDEDFAITLKNLEKMPLSQIHVFPYSKRPNTKAFGMENQISSSKKKERVTIIKALSDKKHKDFLKSNINSQREVIIENRRDKLSGNMKGLTDNYINVLIVGDNKDFEQCQSTVQKVLITSYSEQFQKLIGEIL